MAVGGEWRSHGVGRLMMRDIDIYSGRDYENEPPLPVGMKVWECYTKLFFTFV